MGWLRLWPVQSGTHNHQMHQKLGKCISANFWAEYSPNVRVGFWQNVFFADFIFKPADFVAGLFLLIFVGKVPSRKIPGKILQNLDNKNPRHISAEGPGQPMSPRKMFPLKRISKAMRCLVFIAERDQFLLPCIFTTTFLTARILRSSHCGVATRGNHGGPFCNSRCVL